MLQKLLLETAVIFLKNNILLSTGPRSFALGLGPGSEAHTLVPLPPYIATTQPTI